MSWRAEATSGTSSSMARRRFSILALIEALRSRRRRRLSPTSSGGGKAGGGGGAAPSSSASCSTVFPSVVSPASLTRRSNSSSNTPPRRTSPGPSSPVGIFRTARSSRTRSSLDRPLAAALAAEMRESIARGAASRAASASRCCRIRKSSSLIRCAEGALFFFSASRSPSRRAISFLIRASSSVRVGNGRRLANPVASRLSATLRKKSSEAASRAARRSSSLSRLRSSRARATPRANSDPKSSPNANACGSWTLRMVASSLSICSGVIVEGAGRSG